MDTEAPVQPTKRKNLTGKSRKLAAAKVQALDGLGTKTEDIAKFFGISTQTVRSLKKVKTTDVEYFKEIAAKQFLKNDWEISMLAYKKMKEKLMDGKSKLWEVTGAYKVARDLQKDRFGAGTGNLVINISTDGGISFNSPTRSSIPGEVVE